MPLHYLISACQCVTIIKEFSLMHIIDSEKLRGIYVPVYRLKINGVNYEIDSTFEDKAEFLTYLNEVFRIVNGLEGNFVQNGIYIDYENVEGFNTIEVVAVINWRPVTVIMNTNGTTYQSDDLIGAQLDPRIVVSNQNQQQTFTTDFDPISGTISQLTYFTGDVLSYSYLEPIPT